MGDENLANQFTIKDYVELGQIVSDIEYKTIKRVAIWLQNTKAIESQSDYMNHVHIINHVDIESLLSGKIPYLTGGD